MIWLHDVFRQSQGANYEAVLKCVCENLSDVQLCTRGHSFNSRSCLSGAIGLWQSPNYQPRVKSPRDSRSGNCNNAFFGNKSDTNTDESLYLLLPMFLKSITSGGKLRNRTTLYWSLKRTRNFSINFNIHHLVYSTLTFIILSSSCLLCHLALLL